MFEGSLLALNSKLVLFHSIAFYIVPHFIWGNIRIAH